MNDTHRGIFSHGFRFKISEELLEQFIGRTEELRFRDKETIIPYGKVDTNLYLIKSGIVMNCYVDGEDEKIYGFTIPGAPLISFHSHLMNQPTVFQFVACGKVEVLKISKADIEELMKSSYEFCKFILAVYSIQSYLLEFKHSNVVGDAKERYLWMVRNRPEVVATISTKQLALYLGIAPSYLSYLKRICLKKA